MYINSNIILYYISPKVFCQLIFILSRYCLYYTIMLKYKQARLEVYISDETRGQPKKRKKQY